MACVLLISRHGTDIYVCFNIVSTKSNANKCCKCRNNHICYKSTVVAGFEGFCAENWIM